MDQYLYIPFLVGWTSIDPSYFDVNYRGTIGLPSRSAKQMGSWMFSRSAALLEARCPQSLCCSKAPVRLRPGTKTFWVRPSQLETSNNLSQPRLLCFIPLSCFFLGGQFFVAPTFFFEHPKKTSKQLRKIWPYMGHPGPIFPGRWHGGAPHSQEHQTSEAHRLDTPKART